MHAAVLEGNHAARFLGDHPRDIGRAQRGVELLGDALDCFQAAHLLADASIGLRDRMLVAGLFAHDQADYCRDEDEIEQAHQEMRGRVKLRRQHHDLHGGRNRPRVGEQGAGASRDRAAPAVLQPQVKDRQCVEQVRLAERAAALADQHRDKHQIGDGGQRGRQGNPGSPQQVAGRIEDQDQRGQDGGYGGIGAGDIGGQRDQRQEPAQMQAEGNR